MSSWTPARRLAYMRRYKADERADRIAQGLCPRCGGPRTDTHAECRSCRFERNSIRMRVKHMDNADTEAQSVTGT